MSGQLTFQFSTTAWKPFFWTGWKNRWSMVIRRMCHSPFSHVDLLLDDGNLLGASDSEAPVVAGNPHGVAIRPPDYEQFGIRRRMTLQTDKANAITARLMSQLGKPFDNTALYNFLSASFPDARDWRDTGAWFCAEWAVWGVEKEGYWVPRPLLWPKTRVSPTDMLLLFLFDPNWVNSATFWQPVPGLQLGPEEI